VPFYYVNFYEDEECVRALPKIWQLGRRYTQLYVKGEVVGGLATITLDLQTSRAAPEM